MIREDRNMMWRIRGYGRIEGFFFFLFFFFFISKITCPDRLWGPPRLLCRWYRGHHLSPSAAEVNNEWSYTSNPTIGYLDYQGVDRENFSSCLH